MKNKLIIIAALVFTSSWLTGCLGLTSEETRSPVRQNSVSADPIGFVIDIPETTDTEILNIPGSIGLEQRVFINNSEVFIDSFGNFSAQVQLEPGLNSISIKVIGSDNKSVYSTAKNVNYIVSHTPRLDVVIPATYTSDAENLIIKGITDPGCRVDANGYQVQPDENGNFIVSIPLEKGDNIVKVVSTNQQGKTSTAQQVVSYSLLNNKPPTLVVSSPEPTKDGYISTERIRISGFTEPNNLVEIYNNYYNGDAAVNSLVFKGTTGNGQFSVDVTLSKDGGGINDLQIVATNEFGRTTSETRQIIYKAP